MEWREVYNVGIEPIDGQHKRLVHTITRLQTALACGDINQELANALRFLVDHAREHFAEEERLMREIGFDGQERHRELHRKFAAQVTLLLVSLRQGKRVDPGALLDFLTDWVDRHIRCEDKKIGRWMTTKGS